METYGWTYQSSFYYVSMIDYYKSAKRHSEELDRDMDTIDNFDMKYNLFKLDIINGVTYSMYFFESVFNEFIYSLTQDMNNGVIVGSPYISEKEEESIKKMIKSTSNFEFRNIFFKYKKVHQCLKNGKSLNNKDLYIEQINLIKNVRNKLTHYSPIMHHPDHQQDEGIDIIRQFKSFNICLNKYSDDTRAYPDNLLSLEFLRFTIDNVEEFTSYYLSPYTLKNYWEISKQKLIADNQYIE